MLNAEGVAFGEKLASRVGKIVKGGLIKEVPHAFDKKPNPMKFSKAAEKCYGEACAELNVVFGRKETVESRTQLDLQKDVERLMIMIEQTVWKLAMLNRLGFAGITEFAHDICML